ncbi:MAG: carboxypeptidase-like regulatory domain-containing protein [Cytophagales bacterium]|nr:carboxypeptidase-like regulatory domain-containing protein [Cytophagales bacterium]
MHVKLPHPFLVVLLGLTLAAAPLPTHAQVLALQGRTAAQEGASGQQQSLREALLRLRELHQVDIVFDDKLVTRYAVDAGVVSSEMGLEEKLSRLLNTNGLRFKKTKKDVYLILAPRREKKTGALSSATRQTAAGQTDPRPAGPENTPAPVPPAPAALTLTGRVTAQDGAGVPGASVSLKGTTIGTATDGDGRFSLTVPDGSGTLVISSIGYVTEEILISNRSTIDVTLMADIKSLTEVVVVGYGSQQRKDLTGAISSVAAE